jgi:hypothetical protein
VYNAFLGRPALSKFMAIPHYAYLVLKMHVGCLYGGGGRGYKEGNRVGYNMIPIRTLSLLAYFTYILIDIIIYALGSKPWSSRIFWMVG